MAGKKYSTALIGCGRIGFLLERDPLRYKPCTHYGGALSAGIKVDYACDIDNTRLLCFAETADIPAENLFRDYRELLIKKRPEMVIIASWTDSHADIGILAAKNGAGAIICEKPIASSLTQAQALLRECKKRGVHLIVNHERRYDERYRTAKRLIDSGMLGEIKTVHASVLTAGYRGCSRIEEGGGPLLHDGTHMVDILRFLFGEIKSVRGEIHRDKRDSGFEDRAVAWLKTVNGQDVFIEAGGNRKYFVFELIVSGTLGKLVIGNGYQFLYKAVRSRYYTGFNDLEERQFPGKAGMNYFKREYLEAVSLLKKKSSDITSSGYDGYRALEAVHSVYLSAHLHKQVDLPVKPMDINLKEIFNLR